MVRKCTICNRPNREEIDKQLISGESYRSVAKRFEASESAIYRHREHIPASMVQAQEAKEIAQADNLIEQVESLLEKAVKILDRAEEAGDLKTALLGIREARACLELLARVAATAAALEQEQQKSEPPVKYELVWDYEPVSIYCRKCGEKIEK
jgi:transposase